MRNFIIGILLLFGTAFAYSQKTEMIDWKNQWSELEKLEQQSLPESAAALVEEIISQAVAEKNSPQLIKALIHRTKYEMVVDRDKGIELFESLNEMLEQSSDGVEQALIHSMLAELYWQYYSSYSRIIDSRTKLKGWLPEDIREWSSNLFFDQIVEHSIASVEQQELLEMTDLEDYEVLILEGEDSRRLYPTFYDFLMRRAAERLLNIRCEKDLTLLLAEKNIAVEELFADSDHYLSLDFSPATEEYGIWAPEIYRRHIKSLRERGLREGEMHIELERLQWAENRFSAARMLYAEPALKRMLAEWRSEPFSVEISIQLAQLYIFLRQHGSDSDERSRILGELYSFIKEEAQRYPEYERSAQLENRLKELTGPEFKVTGKYVFRPDGEKKLKLSYRNVSSVTVELYSVDSATLSFRWRYRPRGEGDNVENLKLIKSWRVELPPEEPWKHGESELEIPIKELGSYLISFKTESDSDCSISRNSEFDFAISNLAALYRISSPDNYEFYVVDRVSGEPVKDGAINIYSLTGSWDESNLVLEQTLKTDASGQAIFRSTPSDKYFYFQPVRGEDSGSAPSSLPRQIYTGSGWQSAAQPAEKVSLFTDRSLYRPGQQVYFKAIAFTTSDNRMELLSGKELELRLRDVARREVSNQKLTTNEFGSLSGQFTLPHDILNGQFTIETDNGSVSFRVEEYKRPTFEVSFDKIEEGYRFDQEVLLKGKAENYSGVKLQGASVKYSIERRQIWGRFWGSSVSRFDEGLITTDRNGEFEVRFTPRKSDQAISQREVYSFLVGVEVTDLNGETQRGSYSVTVGDVSMTLSLDIPEKLEKEGDQPIEIGTNNLDGSPIDIEGLYRVSSILDNDSVAKQLLQGSFKSGLQPELKKRLTKLPSGRYRITINCEDDIGNDLEQEKDFLLFSYRDRRPPHKTNEWLLQKRTEFSKERPAEVILGVSDKNVYVLYELFRGNSLLERNRLRLSNENHLFRLPYDSRYGDGVTMRLSYVRDEKFFAHKVELKPESENKELDVRLELFRDRVRPGSGEEWRVSVKDRDGNPVIAELLASMYDFSLEKIYPAKPWSIISTSGSSPGYRPGQLILPDYSFIDRTVSNGYHCTFKDVTGLEFDRFNWFDLRFNIGSQMLRAGNQLMGGEVSVVAFGSAKREDFMIRGLPTEGDKILTDSFLGKVEEVVAESQSKTQSDESLLRSNFDETAFFFPHLRTNEQGETLIAFKVPDSNTKWRFRLFAHDKELNQGVAESFTVSYKELMVTPNLPRFLRHGDRASISTKISNLSDGSVNGTVRLEFFDLLTDEPYSSIEIEEKYQMFDLERGTSGSHSWMFDVPKDIDMIGLRIIAETESFSDGEQHALPVLPNRILVTEAMRMDLNGGENKAFRFDRVANQESDSKSDWRLTLEFSSNPAWYAVQALPLLGEPDSENAISWFASYYSNMLGAHIVKAYPKVAAMIERWKLQGGSGESLLSELEKNRELKSILLEETPWVLAAKSESDQKERLSLLFDLNRSSYLTGQALQQLKQLQQSSGGWSWFKGFFPNIGITQYILYGFKQLEELQAIVPDQEIREMQQLAINYIDSEALRRFERLKKTNEKWEKIESIPTVDLEYLYIRSAYSDFEYDERSAEIINFYSGVIAKKWTRFSPYQRALILQLMLRQGNDKVVKAMLKSFREHATRSDELGLYWTNIRSNLFMSQSAITVHTFIMNAFRLAGAPAEELDQMKRWLLKQKQTEIWESSHATADAIYILLSSGSDWFSSEGEIEISIAGERVKPESKDIGIGYIRESWSRGEIKPEMATVEVSHQGEGPAWGALYYQYFEELDKIEQSSEAIAVQRDYFLDVDDVDGRRLLPIDDDNRLKVGDRVVARITIRADRDMEFLHLKDMRPSAFEPLDQISKRGFMAGGVSYYQTTRDASTNLYIDSMPKGIYVFEYSFYVTRTGSFSTGITTLQSIYAPEFISHYPSVKLEIED